MEKILVVDDVEVSGQMLCMILEDNGFKVDYCMNGLTAVEAFTKAYNKGYPYKYIFFDILMPIMDGHLAIHKIREFENNVQILPSHQVKIIITSQLDDPSNYAIAKFKGHVSAYIVKPYDATQVMAELERIRESL